MFVYPSILGRLVATPYVNECCRNDLEAVRHLGDILQIMIRRKDWKPVFDWRDKQAIKNQVAGPESESTRDSAHNRLQDLSTDIPAYWRVVLVMQSSSYEAKP